MWRKKINLEAIPRVLPFFVYMAFLFFSDVVSRIGHSGWDVRWLYAVKIALVAALLFLFREKYQELRPAQRIRFGELVLAIVLGALVFIAWINLNVGWLVTGSVSAFNPLDKAGINLPLMAIRMMGATLVVPLMEELFWRSFLLRWLESKDFTGVDPARIGLRSCLAVTVLFGFEHNLWFAGMLAAMVYNFLYMHTKNLWLPIVSHAVTNGLLGIWVVVGNHWEFW